MSYKIITIARQFGSGGRQLGQRLSQELHIPMYDRELVEMAADKLGLSPVSIEKVDESALNTFLATYQLPLNTGFPESYGLPLNDTAYLAQSSIIETLAKRGSCIIIGRCGTTFSVTIRIVSTYLSALLWKTGRKESWNAII